jgi:hypothetical protein
MADAGATINSAEVDRFSRSSRQRVVCLPRQGAVALGFLCFVGGDAFVISKPAGRPNGRRDRFSHAWSAVASAPWRRDQPAQPLCSGSRDSRPASPFSGPARGELVTTVRLASFGTALPVATLVLPAGSSMTWPLRTIVCCRDRERWFAPRCLSHACRCVWLALAR